MTDQHLCTCIMVFIVIFAFLDSWGGGVSRRRPPKYSRR